MPLSSPFLPTPTLSTQMLPATTSNEGWAVRFGDMSLECIDLFKLIHVGNWKDMNHSLVIQFRILLGITCFRICGMILSLLNIVKSLFHCCPEFIFHNCSSITCIYTSSCSYYLAFLSCFAHLQCSIHLWDSSQAFPFLRILPRCLFPQTELICNDVLCPTTDTELTQFRRLISLVDRHVLQKCFFNCRFLFFTNIHSMIVHKRLFSLRENTRTA